MNDTDPRCCCKSHGTRLCPLHQPLFEGFWAALILALGLACGGSAESPECPQTAYELEGHYRCTSKGELQTLSCGQWETLEVCDAPPLCSPGPHVGCRVPS